MLCSYTVFFFFQAEDGIRDLVRSRGLGDVYKRQLYATARLWDDGLIDPRDTRKVLAFCLSICREGDVLSLIHI